MFLEALVYCVLGDDIIMWAPIFRNNIPVGVYAEQKL
jgi:hypothetical protein